MARLSHGVGPYQSTRWSRYNAAPELGVGMQWREFIGLIENGACTVVIGLMLTASPTSSVIAQQPPRNCRAVPKIEYGSRIPRTRRDFETCHLTFRSIIGIWNFCSF